MWEVYILKFDQIQLKVKMLQMSPAGHTLVTPQPRQGKQPNITYYAMKNNNKAFQTFPGPQNNYSQKIADTISLERPTGGPNLKYQP